MPVTQISLAAARAKFSTLVEGVLRRGERYVIERHGREVAALVSVPELELLGSASPTAEQPGGALALVGLWQEVADEEIDALLVDLRAARDRDAGRPVELGR
jgi:prevent-host-death family protein